MKVEAPVYRGNKIIKSDWTSHQIEVKALAKQIQDLQSKLLEQEVLQSEIRSLKKRLADQEWRNTQLAHRLNEAESKGRQLTKDQLVTAAAAVATGEYRGETTWRRHADGTWHQVKSIGRPKKNLGE